MAIGLLVLDIHQASWAYLQTSRGGVIEDEVGGGVRASPQRSGGLKMLFCI